ncbi:MAG TPA: ribosome biogenesis GTP-binding protein YihA/YsxC [Clostridia bacterium]|nr:ribosome biogenesis GTP-binding protein YihA/YsxC [Clostridia bacterium]
MVAKVTIFEKDDMIKNAEFITSVGNIGQIRNYPAEIAVAGKSNVGKSSFINFICNNKNLAKTSKEPGRTRLINYFNINKGQFTLVDLPGYGFAKVSDAEKLKWAKLIESYFANAKNLKNVFLLIDIRHEPTEDDKQMIKYLYYYRLPFTVIATKSDKLSRSAALLRKKQIADSLGLGVDNVYISSSFDKTGREEIFKRIEQVLQDFPQ